MSFGTSVHLCAASVRGKRSVLAGLSVDDSLYLSLWFFLWFLCHGQNTTVSNS